MSRALSISAIVCVLLLFIAGCQSPTGGVVISQEPQGPRDIVVNSTVPVAPAVLATTAVKPVPTTQPAPAPQRIPINVLPQQAPEVYIIPEEKPAIDAVQACLDGCQKNCRTAAARACRQTTGTLCKANCGDIIDPSACSTACSLRDARACEPKFKEFCGNKCIERCN